MISIALAIGAVFGILVKDVHTSGIVEHIEDYFDKVDNERFNVLPEYEMERHVCLATPDDSETFVDRSEDTVLYRIPAGPKSPRAVGKRASFIQQGIMCNVESCTLNKLHIATAYLLVDQGYDVWLGPSDPNVADKPTITRLEERQMEHVARCILGSINQTELLVMGFIDGNVQFFGMSIPDRKPEQSKLSKWLEHVPGVKTVKTWYYKAKNYFTRGYEKIVDGFDNLGRNIDVIVDDKSITNLKKKVLEAWGTVSMMIPSLSVHDFSVMMNHPDVYLDAMQLIGKYGYIGESHPVLTEDGYLLAVHRISGGKKYPPKRGKPVVFIQHGILSSSVEWIIMGPTKSLAYLLADEGYDVWLGNSRGNTYSQRHANISNEGETFWNFSFDEMGIYDLPAMVDHVIDNTGQKKINYIGHSQGFTEFVVMLSEKPEYNEKIDRFVAYAPIVRTTKIRSPLIQLLSKFSSSIHRATKASNVHTFLPSNALLTKIGRNACEAKSLYQVTCTNTLFMVAGYDSQQLNKSMIPVILAHFPAGASIKQFVHFGQLFDSKTFRRFDYYDTSVNRAKYGTDEPPEYKISNVKIPGAFFYAENDWLANPEDVETLGTEMKNVELHKIPMKLFNHPDFLIAMDAPILVYYPTIEYLRKSILETP